MKNLHLSLAILNLSLLVLWPLGHSRALLLPINRPSSDTIPSPWSEMDLIGPQSKPAVITAHASPASLWIYPTAAVVGGGAAWLLKQRNREPGIPLMPHDDFVSVPCGQNTVLVDVLANDEGDGLQIVGVFPPSDIEASVENDGLLLISGLGSESISFEYSVEDLSGQTLSAKVILSPFDDQAPEITCPSDISVNCSSSLNPEETGLPMATDDCDGDSLLLNRQDETVVPLSCEQAGLVIRTFIATDKAGNSSKCAQVISISPDTIAPEIICPPDVSIICTSSLPSPDPDITGIPVATDNCTQELVFEYSDDLSAVSECQGDLMRTWVVADACGLTASCLQMITLEPEPCSSGPYDLQLIQTTPPSSPTASDGSIEFAVADPEAHPPPYQIVVNGNLYGTTNQPNFTVQNLSAGLYHIMVLDATTCPSKTVTVELAPLFTLAYSSSAQPEIRNLKWTNGRPEHPTTSTTDLFVTNSRTLTMTLNKHTNNFIAVGLQQAEGQLFAESGTAHPFRASFHLLQSKWSAGQVYDWPTGSLRLSAGLVFRYVRLNHPNRTPPPVLLSTGYGLEVGFELPFGKWGTIALPLSVYSYDGQSPQISFQAAANWWF